MSCILRVYGDHLDPDALIRAGGIEPYSLWRIGERRFPASDTSPRNASSGVRYRVSDADFAELDQQIEDAIRYFRENLQALKRISEFNGVEEAVADFGVDLKPPGLASFCFPPELLTLAGEAGVYLMISVYPVSDEDDDEQEDDEA